jgi:protein CpxP
LKIAASFLNLTKRRTDMNPRIAWQNLGTFPSVAMLGASLLLTAPVAFGQSSGPATRPATSAAPMTPSAATPDTTQHGDARVEAHIKRLHDQLKITAAESDQWDAVAQIMRDNESKLADLVQNRDKNVSAMSAIDNLRTYEEIADAHEDGLKKLVPAFENLYNAMSDAQKKTADAVFRQRVRSRAAAQNNHPAAAKPPNG